MLSLIEALSARLETYRRESETSLEQPAAPVQNILEDDMRPLPTESTNGIPHHGAPRPIKKQLRPWHVVLSKKSMKGAITTKPFNPNPAVAEFVPGAATRVLDVPIIVNGHHILPRAQALEHIGYLWDGNDTEADHLATETARLGSPEVNAGMVDEAE